MCGGGGGIWKELKEEFKKSGAKVIPVFNRNMELGYFAYQDKSSVLLDQELKAMLSFEERKEYLFIKDIWPEVCKIYIYDFNEFAHRFYHILIQRNIDVEVIGSKWDFFMPGILKNKQANSYVLETKRMNIYAEGTNLVVNDELPFENNINNIATDWGVLDILCYVNKMYVLEKVRKYLCNKKILFWSIFFPEFEELETITYEEYWRRKEGFIYTGHERRWNQTFEKEQIKNVSECESFSEIAAFVENNKYPMRNFGNHNTYYRKYGDGLYTIYLIGPCVVSSINVLDKDSMGSHLLKKLLKEKKDYAIVCIENTVRSFVLLESIISSISLVEGDVVLFIDADNEFLRKKIHYQRDIDLNEILTRRNCDWFWDVPIHTNQRGNYEIANEIAERLVEHLSNRTVYNLNVIQFSKWFFSQDEENEIQRYLRRVKEKDIKGKRIGAVVMNCNPMTKGHLYLIEKALDQVDFLYVFIVEENKSELSFDDRIAMVKSVVNKYDCLKVVPSGKFILSYKTMPIYFEKEIKQMDIIDASQDLEIFCSRIVPELGITVRFVGDEPFDRITRQYNDTMKKLFPRYHLKLVEIPRIKQEGNVISASRIRKYLRENKIEEVEKLMPKQAYNILLGRTQKSSLEEGEIKK